MKRRLVYTLGLIALGLVTLVASPAKAQTTAAGPYYANPSWDQKLQCDTQASCPRFIVLSNWSSAAVLDRETGLVWEQATSTRPNFSFETQWPGAVSACMIATTGNRLGWRLPTAQELGSLIDPTTLNLPPGHPFNLLLTFYWTATTNAAVPSQAWTVRPGGFGGLTFVSGAKVGSLESVWCVRGGQGLDAQ